MALPEPPEWMVAGSRKLAEDAEALLKRHEQEDHDGDPCIAERAGMVAFLAHRLGVRDEESLSLMIDYLVEYEHGHAERTHHNGDTP